MNIIQLRWSGEDMFGCNPNPQELWFLWVEVHVRVSFPSLHVACLSWQWAEEVENHQMRALNSREQFGAFASGFCEPRNMKAAGLEAGAQRWHEGSDWGSGGSRSWRHRALSNRFCQKGVPGRWRAKPMPKAPRSSGMQGCWIMCLDQVDQRDFCLLVKTRWW